MSTMVWGWALGLKIEEVLGTADESLKPFTTNILQLLEYVYDPRKNPIVSDARNKTTLNLDQEKFASKEFKALWEKINAKTYYTAHLTNQN